ncbi:LacI family DNA-binding transcriptional regulator [Vibrio cionasavignyae]|uniref:LacI family DNA-binding transcriptional regulator n=1 Tax=Vibrio cionasavignyae TaxID=2910252 RepID=UPI003D10D8EE
MASIKEVAALAGVNRSTVSRIINGEGSFRADTKRRVEEAMAELDYRPSAIARSLAKSNSNMIGLMVTYYTGGFFGQMMNQVQLELDEQQKFLITAQGHHSAEGEKKAIDKFRDLRCDGFILHSRYLSDEELINLSKTTSSFVLLDRYIAGIKERCVTFDHQAASALATSYLIDRGHHHIVCVTGPCDRDSTKARLAGFIQVMSDHKLTIGQSDIIEGDYELDSGYDAMAAVMALQKKPSAIFSTGEEMTRGIMKYCYQHGIQCPEDISIISYDSVDSCRALYPEVTTIEFPISRMAHDAVLLLTEQLGSNFPQNLNRSVEPRIKEGQSVKQVGISNA